MKKQGILNNEHGFFKLLFVLALIVFAIYAGLQFGMPYFRYSSLKNDAKELALMSLGEMDKTRAQVFERAQELNIPIKEKDIEIIRAGKKIRIKTAWSETVDLLGIYETTIDFVLEVEG